MAKFIAPRPVKKKVSIFVENNCIVITVSHRDGNSHFECSLDETETIFVGGEVEEILLNPVHSLKENNDGT